MEVCLGKDVVRRLSKQDLLKAADLIEKQERLFKTEDGEGDLCIISALMEVRKIPLETDKEKEFILLLNSDKRLGKAIRLDSGRSLSTTHTSTLCRFSEHPSTTPKKAADRMRRIAKWL